MEMNMDDGHSGHGPETTVLIILVAFFRVWSTITISDAAHDLLFFAELVSVGLIIIINFPKAMRVLSGKKNKKHIDDEATDD